MYHNVGVDFKVKSHLPLVVVCTYQELGVHTIEISTLYDMSSSVVSSRGGIATTKTTNIKNGVSKSLC